MKLALFFTQEHTGEGNLGWAVLFVVLSVVAVYGIFRAFLPDSLRDKICELFTPQEQTEHTQQEQTQYRPITEENNTPITMKKPGVTFLHRVLDFFSGLFSTKHIASEPETPQSEPAPDTEETADDTTDQDYQFEHTAVNGHPAEDDDDDDDDDDAWAVSHTEINQPK